MSLPIANLVIITKLTEYILEEVMENHPEIIVKAVKRLFEED